MNINPESLNTFCKTPLTSSSTGMIKSLNHILRMKVWAECLNIKGRRICISGVSRFPNFAPSVIPTGRALKEEEINLDKSMSLKIPIFIKKNQKCCH